MKFSLKGLKTKATSLSFGESRLRAKNAGFSVAVAFFRAAMLIAVGYTILSPLLQILSGALKNDADYMNTSVAWIPTTFYWQNFVDAFKVMDYPSSLLNTLLVPVISGLLEVISCGVAAYGFARFKFPERKILYVFLIVLILVPVRLTMLPSFVNYRYFDIFGIFEAILGEPLNLIDTPFTFYLPSLFGVGLQSGIFIMVYIQFLKGIPKELEEAAWIDGAGPIKTFVRIIVPSSHTAILTVSILSIIWHWNEYYMMGLYFNKNRPLSVVLTNIQELTKNFTEYDVNSPTGVVMASCMLFILPVLIFYLIMQKKFIKSIDSVGIVG